MYCSVSFQYCTEQLVPIRTKYPVVEIDLDMFQLRWVWSESCIYPRPIFTLKARLSSIHRYRLVDVRPEKDSTRSSGPPIAPTSSSRDAGTPRMQISSTGCIPSAFVSS